MIGHRSRFQENDDLPLCRDPVLKKKPPFSNARALITRKIMRSSKKASILILCSFVFYLSRIHSLVLHLNLLKVAQNSFQHFPRRSV